MRRILIIQTAFAGDLVLTTPLMTEAMRCFPDAHIDVLCIPGTAPLLENHPSVHRTIVYDKRAGKPRLTSLMLQLRRERYDICISPHRSVRSALLARATGAPLRVGFDSAAGAWLYTHRIRYAADAHEVIRNLRLLAAVECMVDEEARPSLHPSEADRAAASNVRTEAGARPYICIAPGSVWATKRWTEEGFAKTASALSDTHAIVFVGGTSDRALCARIAELAAIPAVNAAGRLSLPASAALIGKADLCISNDSAPVHIASAMGTSVVEIFGATVPEFGFTPFGVPHRIVQREGLACKPCAIHGGDACPIGSFICMRELRADTVVSAARALLREAH